MHVDWRESRRIVACKILANLLKIIYFFILINGFLYLIHQIMCSSSGMLQFNQQFYEELTVARVKTIKFISGAFFWPTGQLVLKFKVGSSLSTEELFQWAQPVTLTNHSMKCPWFEFRGTQIPVC